jgi:hypothetical protein
MPGRLHQAANRYDGVTQRQMTKLADLVANGSGINEAGRRLNLTAGKTARLWANIKAGLGEQAR